MTLEGGTSPWRRALKTLEDFSKSEGHETGLRDIPPREILDDISNIPKNVPAAALAAQMLIQGVPHSAEAASPHNTIEDILNETKPDSIAHIIGAWEHTDSTPRTMEELIQSLDQHGFDNTPLDEGEVMCLAKNIWYEAANQPQEGQKAVALVTLLRMISGKYPKSACGVVYQGWNTRAPQFSWTLEDHKRNAIPPAGAKFKRVTELAHTLHKLKRDPEKLAKEASALGLTSDTLFYKRHDWGKEKMSEQGTWFWTECVETLKDASGKDLRIGDHVFFRAKSTLCKRPTRSTTRR